MSTLKTLTVNGTTYNVAQVVPKASVVLLASAWVGNAGSYSQVVTLAGVTSHTKVDLQTTPEQDEIFHNKTLAFVAENNNGVVTVFSIGTVPQNDYTIQVTLTEVEGKAPIRGNTVGLPNPQPDWDQTDHTKADFIKNKPNMVKTINGAAPDENGNVEVKATVVDETLKESDAAANAKAVGDALTYAGRNLVNTANPFLRGDNVETSGKTVILSYKSNIDTFFRIATTENLVQGEQYVLSFDCTGVPADTQGKKFELMLGLSSEKSYVALFNGRVVVPFKAGKYDYSGSVLIDDTASDSNRPTASLVGDGVFLSNFSIEKGSFSVGYRHNESEYIIPVLTPIQKKQIQALAKRYHEVAKKKETFYYDGDTVQNDYANARCWRKYGTEEKPFYRFAMCCNTFCEALWMGRDVSDFAEVEKDENGTITKIKNKDKYSHKITKAFDWGYMFGFEDRKKIAGVAERDSDGTIVNYYGYQNPNGYNSDNYTNSYSVNSIYNPKVTNTTKYPKQQWFSSFQTQADTARELYEKGYVIPYEELDVGDLVFIKPRYTLNSDYDTFKNNYQWKNISHVAMVYDKAADGTLTFIDCTNVDYDEPFFIFSTAAGYDDQWVARAMNTKNNVVMCARHPAAWGKNNMAGIDRIDYVPMRYTTGYSTGQAKPFTAGMAVTEGLWYVYDNQLGIAKITGKASAWNATYFDIQYKNSD